ncbi:hypothetical protein BDF14DRAFT_1811126 [Spinellus fusiger]|nr:hypothetical protein BDF14DRAFT_1811126 [Spinellus fusiger]
MHVLSPTTILLVYTITSVFAKGGGGGGGGRVGGSGGGSSGSIRAPVGGGGSFSQPRTGPSSQAGQNLPAGSHGFTKGGYGNYGGTAPQYASTKQTYTNYPSTYTGGYGAGSRSGWVGAYNPGLLYWAVFPSFLYLGYHSTYHRYNQVTGAYYAPALITQSNGPSNLLINGTEYTSNKDNYHYTFNISTSNVYPMVDHAYYASSDPRAHPSDFVYRLTFSHIVEFDDANQNGLFDVGQDRILAISSLQNAAWQPLLLSNNTVPTNSSQTYLQITTSATIPYNSTGAPFNVQLIWRASNLQLNQSAPIPLQPNSLQYDFSVAGYPSTTSRLALAQVLTTLPGNTILLDVNATTPIDIANQIKTNQTYGLSVGNFSEGRVEYQNTVNISDPTSTTAWINLNPSNISAQSSILPMDWIWGTTVPANSVSQLLFVSIPYTIDTSSSTVPLAINSTLPTDPTTLSNRITGTVSGWGFLDTDVMNAADSGATKGQTNMMSLSSTLIIATAAMSVLMSF